MNKLLRYSFAVAATLVAGHALAASDETIIRNTSRALGLETDEVTISDRSRRGVTIDYIATTKDGRRFGCYVTSLVVVSDAICTEKKGSGTTQNTTQPNTANNKSSTCNELLRRAGKCE